MADMEEVRFEDLPKVVATLANKIEELCGKIEKVLPNVEISEDKWFNTDELREYLPEHPARQTIYGWTSNVLIPFHKKGKTLRFKKSEIDRWLAIGFNPYIRDIEQEAKEFIEKKRKPFF